ncbi:MAG: (d)CMP kinase [Actinomycetota bacterium]
MSDRRIVAIDGPAGAGKSTVSRELAKRLGLAYVDTGATYRLAALRALEAGVGLEDGPALAAIARKSMELTSLVNGDELHFDGRAVGEEIRTPEVSEATSVVSAHPEVRRVLVEYQRLLVPPPGAVVEGRDIGTVVWPAAGLKVYLDADPSVRAGRRVAERGRAEAVEAEVHERDSRDATRAVGAMRAAPDAVVLDTTELRPSEVVERILDLLRPQRADLFYAAVRTALSGLLRIVFRLDIQGRENVPKRGAVILAPNHRSLIDIPVAAATTSRKVWFMGKEELFESKLSALFLRNLGAFPVRRGRPDRTPLQRALELLAAGEIAGIFPEGTRRPMARFEEMEEGFAYVALKSGAPIVPVAISGTEAVFPPGGKLPRLVKIRVGIGEPFRVGEKHAGMLPRARVRDATMQAQQRFVELMRRVEP